MEKGKRTGRISGDDGGRAGTDPGVFFSMDCGA
jgi:hypothetical protein